MRECTWDGTHGGDVTVDWIEKSEAFLDRAFAKLKGAKTTWCPYSRCGNTHRQTRQDMTQHLCNYIFTTDYTRWTYHGEGNRMRDVVGGNTLGFMMLKLG